MNTERETSRDAGGVAALVQETLRVIDPEIGRSVRVDLQRVTQSETAVSAAEQTSSLLWEIPILFDPNTIDNQKMFKLYELFNDAEDVIADKHGIRVFLAPAVLPRVRLI